MLFPPYLFSSCCRGFLFSYLHGYAFSFTFSAFSFAQTKRNTTVWKMTHRQLILIDDIPGWPAINVCRTFRNNYGNRENYDYSFLRRETWSLSPSVIGKRFLRTMWLYFFTVQFGSQSRGIYSRQIRRLRRYLPGNGITILNLTAYVVFKSFPTTKSVDLISKQMRGTSISSRKKESHRNDEFKVESNECAFWWCRSLNRMQRLRWIQGIF